MCAQYWICPDTVRYSAWAAALTACASSGVSSMVTFTKPLYRNARRHPAGYFSHLKRLFPKQYRAEPVPVGTKN